MVNIKGRAFITILLTSLYLSACGQDKREAKNAHHHQTKNTTMENKMKVEIWSDIVCPFCYIGKRKFESALERFSDKGQVDIVWKSYQLEPNMPAAPGKSVYQLVADKHNVSLVQSKAMHEQLTQTAKGVGLVYNFDKAIPVNTHKAHELIQFAKAYGKQSQAEEALFRAYFTEGRNINDLSVLFQIGTTLGLDDGLLQDALENGNYAGKVQDDISEALKIGVQGVPFFVFNRKYAVSGAQDTDAFLETLEKSFAEWQKDNPQSKLEIIQGKACTPGGECK